MMANRLRKRDRRRSSAFFKKTFAADRAIGHHGGPLIPDGPPCLTHCNAGALATAGDYGTALGVIRGARDAVKRSCRNRR